MKAKMFNKYIAVLMLFFLTILCMTGCGEKEEDYRQIQVYKIDGTATVIRQENSMDAYENMQLQSGDVIETITDSYLQLKLDEDKYILVEPESKLSLQATGNSVDSKTSIQLEKGAIVNQIDNPLSEKSSYEITTPNSTMAVRGTTFRIEVTVDEKGESHAKVAVYGGQVECNLVLPDGTIAEPVLVEKGTEVVILGNDEEVEYVSSGNISYEEMKTVVIDFLGEIVDRGEELSVTKEELVEIKHAIEILENETIGEEVTEEESVEEEELLEEDAAEDETTEEDTRKTKTEKPVEETSADETKKESEEEKNKQPETQQKPSDPTDENTGTSSGNNGSSGDNGNIGGNLPEPIPKPEEKPDPKPEPIPKPEEKPDPKPEPIPKPEDPEKPGIDPSPEEPEEPGTDPSPEEPEEPGTDPSPEEPEPVQTRKITVNFVVKVSEEESQVFAAKTIEEVLVTATSIDICKPLLVPGEASTTGCWVDEETLVWEEAGEGNEKESYFGTQTEKSYPIVAGKEDGVIILYWWAGEIPQ